METEINRRAFVEALVVLPVGVFLVRCSSSGSSGYGTVSTTGNAPAAAPRVSGTNAVYSSSVMQAHYHTFAIALSALSSPLEAGVSGETSSDAGHTHSVSVSATDLEDVKTGGTVQITTSSTGGHSHVFTFVKISAAA